MARKYSTESWTFGILFVSFLFGPAAGVHHMSMKLEPRQDGGSVPLSIANWCSETIYPGILTQAGTGPSTTGFELEKGNNKTLSVSSSWQGRVWGRTNCSFNDQGQASTGVKACSTGDCGGALQCKIAGEVPVTLAEFTLNQAASQDFYDISLVDGYNIPLAIVMLANGNSRLQNLSQSTTNPSCVGSIGNLSPTNFDPYKNGQQFLGTSGSDPLPFENKNSQFTVSNWCPWDLQVSPPTAPGDGVYPYPDGNVQRPAFDPCYSACAKYNTDAYCCKNSYDGVGKCHSNYYSTAAKSICPDAYSFAYDDQDSTFIVPTGGGFEIIFCPGGRSTTIIKSKGSSAISHGGSPSGSLQLLNDGITYTLALSCTVGFLLWELLAF
ncbi:thaumatin-like protein 1 [Acrodontium crateriforme]|uniref:Thaumatin-like protein 1 n=1 Tax=Acrodontium crateriforme TaxID=150365 RepID=A0AAQ3M9D7_9PEZI|nr:thaumatin-like protein 1 [Acrodontium crateriforme]